MKSILMRGFPGCGKTSWAKTNYPDAWVISADNYFCDKFDPAKLPDAHNWCLRGFIIACEKKNPLIVVDNTNTRVFELAPYYRIAECFGYDVEIVQILADPTTCINSHGVPFQTVENYAKSIESVPPWWKVKYVVRV